MNKKKLMIIAVIIVLLICGIIGALVLISHNKDDKNLSDTKPSTGKTASVTNWLKVSTVSELEELAKKNSRKIEYDINDAYVSDVPFGDSTTTYAYTIDSDKNLTKLTVGKILVSSTQSGDSYVMEKVSSKELSKRIQSVLDWLSKTLNVNIGKDFCIFSDKNEVLSVDKDSSYQQILDGTACLELRILDTDDSVWVFYVESVGAYNMIACTLEHHMADSEEAELPCYVAVEE